MRMSDKIRRIKEKAAGGVQQPDTFTDDEQDDELNGEVPEKAKKGVSGVPAWVQGDDDVPEDGPDEEKAQKSPEKRKNLKILVVDHGLFVCVAKALADAGAEVWYFSEWDTGSPTPDRHFIGHGLDGVTRANSVFDCIAGIDNDGKKGRPVDLVVFPDVGKGDFKRDLEARGVLVCGTGRGEILEDDRVFFRKKLKELGMLYAPYEVIKTGIDDLRTYLQGVKDKFVKISLYRGCGETFYHEDYAKSKTEINRLAHTLGVLDKHVDFVIEDPIEDAIEVGAEWFCTDSGYLPIGMYGYEIKNKFYIGKMAAYDDVPEPIKSVMDKFLPVYQEYKVRGELSVEMRVNKEGTYFIDPCMRFASPPGESVCRAYDNLPEIMMAVAHGEVIEPKVKDGHKYVAQVMLQSREAASDPIAISFPDKIKDQVALRNVCREDGQLYFMPIGGETVIGAALGWGDTVDEAIDMAMDAAKQVDGGDIYYDHDGPDKAREQIKNGEKLGISF